MSENQCLRTITVLPVKDIAESCDWYEKALQLETIYLHEGEAEGEATNYAILHRDGIEIHLFLDEDLEIHPWMTAGNGYLYLKVEDVEKVFEEVKTTGIEIKQPLKMMSWGMRNFKLVDPSGNSISIEEDKGM